MRWTLLPMGYWVREYGEAEGCIYVHQLFLRAILTLFPHYTSSPNGESLNQRSYKADADLSEEGHRYAENLKNFLLSYREQKQAANSEEKPRQLTVGWDT
ncbi:hypothetical protein BC936DRAFT_142623, partial [Jimgerdemannia flammicorona]